MSRNDLITVYRFQQLQSLNQSFVPERSMKFYLISHIAAFPWPEGKSDGRYRSEATHSAFSIEKSRF